MEHPEINKKSISIKKQLLGNTTTEKKTTKYSFDEKIPLKNGSKIMLTLTLPSDKQYLSIAGVPYRVRRIQERCMDIVYKELNECCKRYDMYMEMSEVLCNEGSMKRYPRLHFHGILTIKYKLEFYSLMGYLAGEKGFNYHITVLDTKDKLQKYKKYVKKQFKDWRPAMKRLVKVSFNQNKKPIKSVFELRAPTPLGGEFRISDLVSDSETE